MKGQPSRAPVWHFSSRPTFSTSFYWPGTFWDHSQAVPSQDLFLARIIPENQGVNHTPLRRRSRAHGALRANFQPPGCCGQCSSGQLRAAQGSSGQLS